MRRDIEFMFTVVVPVLNEEENLRILLPRLQDCEILICDNGSTDNSVVVSKSLGATVLEGTGTVTDAILRGIGAAKYDRIVVMDADLSHPSFLVPVIAEQLRESDIVVGSRCCSNGGSGDTLRNRILSKGLNLLTIGLVPGVRDRASGFFGIRKELTSVSIRNTIKPMLEYLVRSEPTSVGEIPFTFAPRVNGKSKLGKPVLKTFWDVSLLYLHKLRRLIRYLIVGVVCTVLVFSGTYIITELGGVWYLASLAIMVAIIELAKFIALGTWAFGKETSCNDADYEWNAWYRGNPIQKYWKRRIGKVTKEFLGDPASLLDIGCGSSPQINQFHCRRVGIDESQEKLDFIGKYSTAEFTQHNLDGREIPCKSGTFDAVVCNNVLEHLEQPETVVADIGRLLNRGGSVVITVPNFSNPFTRIVEWLYSRFGAYAGEHKQKFTVKFLDEMCSVHRLQRVVKKSVFTDVVCLYRKRGDKE